MQTDVHILNGDVLKRELAGIDGNVIVFRECLIHGPVSGNVNDELWRMRSGNFSKNWRCKTRSITKKVFLK